MANPSSGCTRCFIQLRLWETELARAKTIEHASVCHSWVMISRPHALQSRRLRWSGDWRPGVCAARNVSMPTTVQQKPAAGVGCEGPHTNPRATGGLHTANPTPAVATLDAEAAHISLQSKQPCSCARPPLCQPSAFSGCPPRAAAAWWCALLALSRCACEPPGPAKGASSWPSEGGAAAWLQDVQRM